MYAGRRDSTYGGLITTRSHLTDPLFLFQKSHAASKDVISAYTRETTRLTFLRQGFRGAILGDVGRFPTGLLDLLDGLLVPVSFGKCKGGRGHMEDRGAGASYNYAFNGRAIS